MGVFLLGGSRKDRIMGDEWIEGCSLITLGWHTIKREVLDRYSSGVNLLNVSPMRERSI